MALRGTDPESYITEYTRPGRQPRGKWMFFFLRTPLQMLPELGSICGKLTKILLSNRLQGSLVYENNNLEARRCKWRRRKQKGKSARMTARNRLRSPTPYTLHPTPYTPHPTPHTLYPIPYTLHPTPYTLTPTPQTPRSAARRDNHVDRRKPQVSEPGVVGCRELRNAPRAPLLRRAAHAHGRRVTAEPQL